MREAFAKPHQIKERRSFPGAPTSRQAEPGCALHSIPQSSVCEETIPVATESTVFVSKVTKTHKKTRAFRKNQAGTACLPQVGGVGATCPELPSPGRAWPTHPAPSSQVARGSLDALTRLVKGMWGWGGRWRSLECPCAASRAAPAPDLAPAGARREARPLCHAATLLYVHLARSVRREKPSGARARPPSQERPASSGGPSSLARAPFLCAALHRVRGDQGPQHLPCLDRGLCAGKVRCEITAHTGVHADRFLFFRKKKNVLFPVFCFLFFFFKDFSFSPNFRPGSRRALEKQ